MRKGIPPDGHVRKYTVGRKEEINRLLDNLKNNETNVLLLQANYGAGKTHLLRFVKEHALDMGFAVSYVSLDSKSNIRFNRLDQILGAVNSNIEIPNSQGRRGIRNFFNFVANEMEKPKYSDFRRTLSDNGKWGYSDLFDSSALFIALRAWKIGTAETKDIIEDWLCQPWNYKALKKQLYKKLIFDLNAQFRDPRKEWQFYADDIFVFDKQGHEQAWSTLRDLQMLAKGVGLKGIILLFDEFEDILNNMTNVAHQEAAFWNLFQFSLGKKYPGLSFYAVTPEFVSKCYRLLQRKGRDGVCISTFDALPTFQMAPLDFEELEELSLRIMQTHGEAYCWEPDMIMKASELKKLVRQAASIQIQDRSRQAIIKVVRVLDELLDKNK